MPALPAARRPSGAPNWLFRWGAVGTAGAVLVVAGAAQPASPFTSKLPGSWWFGVPASSPTAADGTQWLGVLAVYAGLVALVAAWYGVVTTCRRSGTTRVGPLVAIGVAWTVPVVVGPPLMSRDVYAYAAQGALAARGGDPYTTGVAALTGSPYLHLVDPLWRHSASPYGPLFLELARAAALVGGHRVVVTVFGLRLVAVAGMALLAVAVPLLARSYGRSPSTAFALAVLNPLLLVTLVGAAHNDALMLGLLAAGVAVARAGGRVTAWAPAWGAGGVVLCALATTVKAPAFAGVVFVGWSLAGAGSGWRRRVGTTAAAVFGGAAVVGTLSAGSGWGVRWLTVADPGRVVSWLDPATAAGLLLGRVATAVGLGAHGAGAVTGARVAGLGLAAVLGLVLLLRTDRMGVPAALGWTLLAFALLGPIVWPWYETWGLTLMAVSAGARTRRAVLALSALGCFATVPAHLSWPGAALLVAGAVLAAWTAGLLLGVVRCWRAAAPPPLPAPG